MTTVHPHSYTIELLEEVAELLDRYADVRDSEDGPLPNAEMSLQGRVELHIVRLKRQESGPGNGQYRPTFVTKRDVQKYIDDLPTYGPDGWWLIREAMEDVCHLALENLVQRDATNSCSEGK